MKEKNWTKVESTLTVNDIRKYMMSIFYDRVDIVKQPIGYVKDCIYHLGDGVYSGKQGWDNYIENFKEKSNDKTKDRASDTENRTEENNVYGGL